MVSTDLPKLQNIQRKILLGIVMQLEMFTTTLGLAGQRTRPALDTPTVAIANNAPDTSREAGEKAKEHSGKQRELIHFWIKWAAKSDAKGMTGDELSVLLQLPAQSVSARINGLHKDAWIVDSGLRRKTRYGRNAIVWVAC
jgi:hypothetical protein